FPSLFLPAAEPSSLGRAPGHRGSAPRPAPAAARRGAGHRRGAPRSAGPPGREVASIAAGLPRAPDQPRQPATGPSARPRYRLLVRTAAPLQAGASRTSGAVLHDAGSPNPRSGPPGEDPLRTAGAPPRRALDSSSYGPW